MRSSRSLAEMKIPKPSALSSIASALIGAALLTIPATGREYHYGVNTQLDLVPFAGPVADKAVELGADVIRIAFGWDVIESSCKGCFDWTRTDAWRDQARRTGRRIFASI